MAEGNGSRNGRSDLGWRLAIALGAVLVSVLGSWFAFGRDAVTHTEVQSLIQSTSPYSLDRAGIQARLSATEVSLHDLQVEEQRLEELIRVEEIDLAKLAAKVALLKK